MPIKDDAERRFRRNTGTILSCVQGLDVPLYLLTEWRSPSFKLELREGSTDKDYISPRDIEYEPANEIAFINSPWGLSLQDPTPDEIKARAAEIRDSWTDEVERQRRTGTSVEDPGNLVPTAAPCAGTSGRATYDMMRFSALGTPPERKYRGNKGEDNRTSKLTDKRVKQIRAKYSRGTSILQLSELYGMSVSTIESVVKKRTWGHVK